MPNWKRPPPGMAVLKNRFPPSMCLNYDETPIPFEYLDGSTYAAKGSHTVGGKSDRSGWNKRQATLILYIFADGIHRIPPKIIFHGKPTEAGGQIEANEAPFYSPDVEVAFNDTAYNNEGLTVTWIKEELVPLTGVSKDNPLLLVLDCAAFHKTDEIRALLKHHHVEVSMVPPGMTSLCQPLDTHVNKIMKAYMREETDKYSQSWEELNPGKKWSVSDKRVMVTYVVTRAWKRLCDESQAVVIKSFVDTGIYLAADGSEDHLIKIKGLDSIVVGDYTIRDREIEGYEHREIPKTGDHDVAIDATFHQGYEDTTVIELKKQIKARGLKGGGACRRKDDYIALLRAADVALQAVLDGLDGRDDEP